MQFFLPQVGDIVFVAGGGGHKVEPDGFVIFVQLRSSGGAIQPQRIAVLRLGPGLAEFQNGPACTGEAGVCRQVVDIQGGDIVCPKEKLDWTGRFFKTTNFLKRNFQKKTTKKFCRYDSFYNQKKTKY